MFNLLPRFRVLKCHKDNDVLVGFTFICFVLIELFSEEVKIVRVLFFPFLKSRIKPVVRSPINNPFSKYVLSLFKSFFKLLLLYTILFSLDIKVSRNVDLRHFVIMMKTLNISYPFITILCINSLLKISENLR